MFGTGTEVRLTYMLVGVGSWVLGEDQTGTRAPKDETESVETKIEEVGPGMYPSPERRFCSGYRT